MNIKEELLLNRQIKNIRFLTYIRIGLLAFWVLSTPLLAKSTLEMVLTYTLSSSYLIYIFCSLYFLKNKKITGIIGGIGAIFDNLICVLLPIIYYLSVGGDKINPAYMIKSPFFHYNFLLFLFINVASIQPLTVIINCSLGAILQSAHLLYLVINFPELVTNDYVSHNVGGLVSPAFVLTVITLYLTCGVIMYIFTKIIKETILKGIEDESINNQLSRYFSPKIRKQLLANNDNKNPLENGVLKEVVIMFCDIRNFTSFCEKNSPKHVVEFLKEYHSTMVEVIFKYNGTLDKFIGDGIMVTFGTPNPSANDAINSCRAALEMFQKLSELNNKRSNSGQNIIEMGIGIHYGQAIIGNIGTRERLEYTAIGDSVNIASRLESSTKLLKEHIIISEALKKQTNNTFQYEPKGTIALKGRKKEVNVFSLKR